MLEAKPEYIAAAERLSQEERERTLSRMRGKLPKKFLRNKLDEIQAVAIQLEIEEKELNEWLEKVRLLRDGDAKAGKKKK